MQEAAGLALPELSRLRSSLASAREAKNSAQGQVRTAQARLRRLKEEEAGLDAFSRLLAMNEERRLKVHIEDLQGQVMRAQAKLRGAEAAAQMMEKVTAIFARAGLCEEPPPAPVAPARGAGAAGGQGRGRGGGGTSNAGAQQEGGANDGEAGTSAAGAAAAAAEVTAGPSADVAGEGGEGAGPSTSNAAAATAATAATAGATAEGNGGPAAPVPDGPAAAPKAAAEAVSVIRPAPLPPHVPISFVLAAEAVSGKQLLQRDARGWVLVMPPEDVGDGAGKEKIPSRAFAVQELLNSVHLPSNAPEAPTPRAIKSVPKRFQLQGLAWMMGREAHGDAVGRGLLHLHPSWVQLVTASGFVMYVHRCGFAVVDACLGMWLVE